MRRFASLVLIVSAIFSVAGCQKQGGEVVTLFAAASTIDALTEILKAFERDDVLVRTNFASSSSLAMLLLRGAEADIFLSAHQEWADQIQARFTTAKRIDLLENQLVLVTARASEINIDSLADLTSSSIHRIAMGDPDSVPAGKYARRCLQEQSVWEEVQTRVAAAADVRQALALVEQGAAEVGFVYASDIVGRDDIRVLMNLDEVDLPIIYPLVRLRHQHQNPVVDELVEFICSDEATRIFARHGFRPHDHQQGL